MEKLTLNSKREIIKVFLNISMVFLVLFLKTALFWVCTVIINKFEEIYEDNNNITSLIFLLI